MNRDDIINMAREVGASTEIKHVTVGNGDGVVFTPHELTRFAAIVAAAERHAILQMSSEQWFKTQADFEVAIRARGQI